MSRRAPYLGPSPSPRAFPVAQQRNAEPSSNLAVTGTGKVTRRLDQASVAFIQLQQKAWRPVPTIVWHQRIPKQVSWFVFRGVLPHLVLNASQMRSTAAACA
jgi:hypothetical protein